VNLCGGAAGGYHDGMRSTTSILVLCAALLGGCANTNDVSFFIAGHLAIEGTGADCTVKVDNDLILRGTLDVAAPCGGRFAPRTQYFLFPLYVNQTIDRESSGPLRADPNGVFVEGAEVELRNQGGQPLAFAGPNPFTVMASSFVPSAEGTDEARAVGTLEIVPAAYGVELDSVLGGGDATIVASVTAFGHTNGDVSVETGEFLWPIDICHGCLFQETPATADLMASTVLSCQPGQDALSQLVCPP